MSEPIRPTEEIPDGETTDEVAKALLDGKIPRGSPNPPLDVEIGPDTQINS